MSLAGSVIPLIEYMAEGRWHPTAEDLLEAKVQKRSIYTAAWLERGRILS